MKPTQLRWGNGIKEPSQLRWGNGRKEPSQLRWGNGRKEPSQLLTITAPLGQRNKRTITAPLGQRNKRAITAPLGQWKKGALLATMTVPLLILSGCGGGASGSAGGSGPIKIGASIPLTGSLAGFGPIIQQAYQADVDRVNAAGGIKIGDQSRQLELLVRDSKSDPNTVAQQSRDLVLKDGVVGLLGSVSPPLAIPAANVAEQQKIPFVSTLTPVEAWKAGNPAGWKYSWDFFFDEDQQTETQFQGADAVKTNKKVALFTDNEQDGIVMGKLWEKNAPKFGYTIATHAEFPVGTTDYSTFIQKAKGAGAEILIAQMIPPDSFALWKQMKSLRWTPTIAHCLKCGAPAAFQKALGPLAEGTQGNGWMLESSDPVQAEMTKEFTPKLGDNLDLQSFLAEFSAAKILTDAIAAAGSTDADKINEAVGKTDTMTAFGQRVAFDETHSAAVKAVNVQWQGTKMPQVFPKATGSMPLQFPAKGLA